MKLSDYVTEPGGTNVISGLALAEPRNETRKLNR